MGIAEPPMYGRPPMYAQQQYYEQQPPMYAQPPYGYQHGYGENPNYFQQQEHNRGGMGAGAKVAMAAAGGLAVGAGGMYLAEHMDDVGQAFGSAEHWMGGAVHDVEGFAEHFVEDIF